MLEVPTIPECEVINLELMDSVLAYTVCVINVKHFRFYLN